MPGSATSFSLLVLGPCTEWELPAEELSWRTAGLNADGNVGCSSGADVSVGILPIKADKK